MLVPISWLKEYVDIDIPVELLAERLTLAGLEVGQIHYIGVPQGFVEGVRWPPSEHLVWNREKLLFAARPAVKRICHEQMIASGLLTAEVLRMCCTTYRPKLRSPIIRISKPHKPALINPPIIIFK